MEDPSFKTRIQQRYPEGLTGVFAVGGTRTTYILEQNRDKPDPGRIEDFAAHGEYLLRRYWQLIDLFFDLGGQNMIITAFSFRGFYNRGAEYGALITQEMGRFIDESSVEYYRSQQIDPYFTGVDTLLLQPEDSPIHQMGQQFVAFQKNWPYRAGRPRLVWEIASMPLYSFWQFFQSLSETERAQIDAQIASETNLEEIYRMLYRRFAQAAYGTDIPMPHFYMGTNKSGDLKWRSPMPLALSGGDYLRMFYTPYPTLFITRETLQTMLADLAFNERFYSAKTDYGGQYTPELVQAEYERVMALSTDPETTLGLARKVTT
ncbi:MAG: hypothetical protein K8J31_29955 [Anaerolineae bacterium]|nr:hypothetical protein [Anaerolineae bacterium]